MAADAEPPNSLYDVHSDHLETPRMLTDSSGLPAWRASYEAFGRAHVSADPDGSVVTPDPEIDFNIRFPGQYFDAESGLHYNFFRTYDPGTGRYTSVDPIGQMGGINVYVYVVDNPINLFDSSGLGDLIPFPKNRVRPPGSGLPRGPADIHNIGDARPYRMVMDPKRMMRGVGTVAATAAAGYATYCAASRGFCYLGQSALSPADCMSTFDPHGLCCAIPGGGDECDPKSPDAAAAACPAASSTQNASIQ